MIRHHMIVLDRATALQLNAIHEAVKLHGNGWWHHFESMWIVGSNMNSAQWRDLLQPILVGGIGSMMVVQVNDPGWAYYGLDAANRCEWMRNTFNR